MYDVSPHMKLSKGCLAVCTFISIGKEERYEDYSYIKGVHRKLEKVDRLENMTYFDV